MNEESGAKRNRDQLDCYSTEVSPEHKKPTTMALTLKDLEILRYQISRDLDIKLQQLINQVQKINNSVNNLETKTRENNLIVYGFTEPKSETLELLLKNVDNLWTKLNVSGILINNAYRLGKPKDGHSRPLLLKLVRYIDKRNIRSNRAKVSKDKIFFSDD